MNLKFLAFIAPLTFAAAIFAWAFGCGDNPGSAEAPIPPAAGKAQSAANGAASGTDPAKRDSSPKQLTVLKVPFPSEPSAPSKILIGDERGEFQKRNLKLDFIGVIPTTQLVAAVVSGQIDVSHGSHINRTIAGISAGAKIKAVVAGTETSKRVPHMIAIVPKNSAIKTPQDLVGKKIGIPTIGGCNEYTPYAWLDKHGIKNPKSKIEVTVIAEKNLEQVLRQGDIDVAMTHKVPEETLKKGEFDIVFSDYDVWGEDGGNTPQYFSLQFIQDHPDVVSQFVAAVADTMNWANANPKEAIEITAKRTNMDVNRLAERYYAPDGIIKPATADVWIKLLTEFGEIKPGITREQIYTNEFNPYYRKAS
jgi:ABC-type nitrate/sulfonate/bicarbonate transport system substrate-binding protein